jgi:CRISPR/Cas system CSM-associated protein Csm4 (group 5 of RAMP superfamily)
VANNGVYEKQNAVKRENEKERGNIKSKHGQYEIKDVYFGTPHSRSGSLYQLSTITVNGSMKLTFMAASPIVSDEELAKFANAFINLLENVRRCCHLE